MTTRRYITLGRYTALMSFLLSTAIFCIYFLTSSFDWIFVGYGLLFLVNTLVLAALINAKQSKGDGWKLNRTIALMLINIPIVLAYCWGTMILTNTMRVTFTNSTETIMTDLHVSGCELKHIEKLEAGQSKTIWIAIPGDCEISIDYLINGYWNRENVVGYVTNNMGQKMKYNIGGQNGDLF